MSEAGMRKERGMGRVCVRCMYVHGLVYWRNGKREERMRAALSLAAEIARETINEPTAESHVLSLRNNPNRNRALRAISCLRWAHKRVTSSPLIR